MSHPHPELGSAPELPEGGLRIVALGGLGEVGRNMTVFEHAGRLLVVDCGVLFPEDFQPGVDLILPDFDYIRDRLDLVDGIVLTHAHEDHIGAVPYLLREKADIPVIGSRLTLAMIEAKLQEHRISPYTLEVREGQRERFGPFDCEFVAVNHSIPDALAVAIRTPASVRTTTANASGIEWLTAMNSRSKDPNDCRSPSATSYFGARVCRCSRSFASSRARVSFEPMSGMSGRSRNR